MRVSVPVRDRGAPMDNVNRIPYLLHYFIHVSRCPEIICFREFNPYSLHEEQIVITRSPLIELPQCLIELRRQDCIRPYDICVHILYQPEPFKIGINIFRKLCRVFSGEAKSQIDTFYKEGLNIILQTYPEIVPFRKELNVIFCIRYILTGCYGNFFLSCLIISIYGEHLLVDISRLLFFFKPLQDTSLSEQAFYILTIAGSPLIKTIEGFTQPAGPHIRKSKTA